MRVEVRIWIMNDYVHSYMVSEAMFYSLSLIVCPLPFFTRRYFKLFTCLVL